MSQKLVTHSLEEVEKTLGDWYTLLVLGHLTVTVLISFFLNKNNCLWGSRCAE